MEWVEPMQNVSRVYIFRVTSSEEKTSHAYIVGISWSKTHKLHNWWPLHLLKLVFSCGHHNESGSMLQSHICNKAYQRIVVIETVYVKINHRTRIKIKSCSANICNSLELFIKWWTPWIQKHFHYHTFNLRILNFAF